MINNTIANTHITILWFPIADAAAKSRGEGKSPKEVSSDHCHISETRLNNSQQIKKGNTSSKKSISNFTAHDCQHKGLARLNSYPCPEPRSHPT